MKGKVTRNIFLLFWIALTVALGVWTFNNCSTLTISVIIGALIGIVGISTIRKSIVGWFVFNVGLAVLLVPFSNFIGVDIRYSNNIKELVGGFGFLIAMQLFFDDAIRNQDAKKRCTVPFEAKCVNFAQNGSSSVFVPIYRYHNKDGKTNMFYGNNLAKVNPKLGDIITVFVNKKNENDVYCPTSKAILMLRYLVGAVILGFSTGALIIL